MECSFCENYFRGFFTYLWQRNYLIRNYPPKTLIASRSKPNSCIPHWNFGKNLCRFLSSGHKHHELIHNNLYNKVLKLMINIKYSEIKLSLLYIYRKAKFYQLLNTFFIFLQPTTFAVFRKNYFSFFMHTFFFQIEMLLNEWNRKLFF